MLIYETDNVFVYLIKKKIPNLDHSDFVGILIFETIIMVELFIIISVLLDGWL